MSLSNIINDNIIKVRALVNSRSTNKFICCKQILVIASKKNKAVYTTASVAYVGQGP